MTSDQPRPEETQTDASTAEGGKARRPPAGIPSPMGEVAAANTTGPAATKLGEPTPANSLTPEEQMALFAKELQEKDWGHQPC